MQGERNRKTNLSPTGQLRPLRSNSVISNLSVPLLPLAATPRPSSGGPAWTFKKSTSDFGIDRGLRGFTRHKGLSVGSGVRRGSPGLASVTASPGTSGANRNAFGRFEMILCSVQNSLSDNEDWHNRLPGRYIC